MRAAHVIIVVAIVLLPVPVELLRKSLPRLLRLIVLTVALVSLLALDWAALHDIFSGRQPHYRREYAILAASAGVLAFLLLRWWSRRQDTARAG